MITSLTCFKCHQDTAVLTYEENRVYKVACLCGCMYTFEHSSMACAEQYHAQIVELHGEIDRNDKLKTENAQLRAQLTVSRQREQAAVEDLTQMARDKLLGTCTFCKHKGLPDMRFKPCKGCKQPNFSSVNFEWGGAK